MPVAPFRVGRGFTLIELLVVIAIIGTLASIVMVALGEAREKGRDGARKSQIQEILKAVELYYTDGSMYPLSGGSSGTGDYLDAIDASFYSGGTYLNRLPLEADTRYYYCVSSNRKSIMLAVDTEDDKSGSGFCHVLRGVGPDYGCNAWMTVNASDSCSSRF